MSKKISHFHTVQSKHPSRNCIGFDLLQYGAHTHLPPIICSSMKVFIFFLLNAHKPPLYDIPSVCHIGVRLSWERRTGAQSQFDATERERDEVDITCCLFFGLYKFFIIILVYAFGCIFFFYWFVCHSMYFVQVARLPKKQFSFFLRRNIVVFLCILDESRL